MAKIMNLATLVTLAIAATLFRNSAATTFIVGDTAGWAPDPTATLYKTWASKYTFTVGDVLVFKFTTGYHTVAKVTKESYDTCDVSKPIEMSVTGPASITLNETGEVYFICTVDQHCAYNQKVTINVQALTSSPPSSPPSLEPTPSPLPETPSPDTNAPAHAPTASDMAPSHAPTPPALGPGGPAPTTSTTTPPPATTPSAGGPAPTGSKIAPPPKVTPPTRSPPPTGLDTPEPPTSPPPQGPSPSPPPSGATRTGLASIFTIFISVALCFLF